MAFKEDFFHFLPFALGQTFSWQQQAAFPDLLERQSLKPIKMVQVRKFLMLKLTETPLLSEAREWDRLHRGPVMLVGSELRAAFSKGTAGTH